MSPGSRATSGIDGPWAPAFAGVTKDEADGEPMPYLIIFLFFCLFGILVTCSIG
jgi:hypothetical protein